MVFFTNPDLIFSAKKLGIKSFAYIPLIVDLSKYPKDGIIQKNIFDEKNKKDKKDNKNKKGSSFTFFCPTRWDWKIKGVDRVIRAYARLSIDYPDTRLVLVDSLDEPDRQKTYSLIHDLGLSDRIEIRFHMNKERLIPEYCSSDVVIDQFILGSIGLVTLEAMACGKPVIVYMNEEPLKILKESIPPVLNSRTEEEILSSMRLCISDRKKVTAIGKRSREFIEEIHSPKAVIGRILGYYRMLGLIPEKNSA